VDPAFLRRLRFVVQFPFPEVAEREAIWRRAFPTGTPTNGLDTAKLARLRVTGGSIRNIALGAAFLAADEAAPIQPRHVLHAATTEYRKLELVLGEAEIRGLS
jgi:SpoVK/Ycf46/Vps4 family AAA+-type ATPase